MGAGWQAAKCHDPHKKTAPKEARVFEKGLRCYSDLCGSLAAAAQGERSAGSGDKSQRRRLGHGADLEGVDQRGV